MKLFPLPLISVLCTLLPGSAHANEEPTRIGLGGFLEHYAVYSSGDDASISSQNLDLRKYSELHLSAERILAGDLKTGGRLEISVDRADSGDSVQESFLYVEGQGGRINLGEEDGAAFLLQVGAPAADELVDGARPHISAFSPAVRGGLNYAHDDFGYANKVTYLTPVLRGFQAGFSYVPSGNAPDINGWTPALTNDNPGNRYERAWEAAARYQIENRRGALTLGAGLSIAPVESASGPRDALRTWNTGMTYSLHGVQIGGAYLRSDNGAERSSTFVAGASFDNGPAHIGASYLRKTVGGSVPDGTVTRWSGGGTYQWAPGVTWRGALQVQTADVQEAQLLLGTKIEF